MIRVARLGSFLAFLLLADHMVSNAQCVRDTVIYPARIIAIDNTVISNIIIIIVVVTETRSHSIPTTEHL